MLIGLFVGLMFLACVPGWRKWPVVPASAIPNSLLIWIVLADLFAVFIVLKQLLMVTVNLAQFVLLLLPEVILNCQSHIHVFILTCLHQVG